VRQAVPLVLRVSAALGWRLLVVVAALYVLAQVVAYVAAIAVPVAIALLLAALLAPAVRSLQERGAPRWVATAVVLVVGLAVVGGVLTFVVVTFVDGVPALVAQLRTSIESVVGWLSTGPLHLSQAQLTGVEQQILSTLSANQSAITAGALTTAATVGELATEILLTIFTLIFFLHDGHGIWTFLLGIVPSAARRRVDVASRRAIAALASYTRATAVVAVVDGAVIGIGLGILGVPLAFPLAALVFFGAFIPIIGAVVAGTLAVLVALVANGPAVALIILLIIVAEMQLESHVLQPLLLGRAVKLHPLAVVLAIATGLLVGGIAGALLSVPLLAALNSAIRSLRSESDHGLDPETVHTSEPEETGPDEPDLEREPDLADALAAGPEPPGSRPGAG
jgi:putative heme transporter